MPDRPAERKLTAILAADVAGYSRLMGADEEGTHAQLREHFAALVHPKIEDLEACEKAGMVPYVPRPQRGPSVREGLFRKDEFNYDAETDSLICPAGQQLHPYSSSLMRGLKKINYANRAACRDCPLRPRCTKNQFRSVSRLENEAVLDRMAARLALRPGILDQRRESIEHPFGTIKQWMYQGAFLMRGLEKVRAEFSLTALAYNLRRVLNLVAFDELMAAVKAAPG
jgi:hypothetical protein